MTLRRITTEEAARRVLGLYSQNVNRLFRISTVARRTRLTERQVRRAERYLKTALAEHPDLVPDVRLHITMGNVSEHGLVRQEDDSLAYADGLARADHQASRAESELDYHIQKIARTADADTARLLRRSLVQQRAARESLNAARERLAVNGRR